MEMEEINTRLLALEAKVHVQQLVSQAHREVMWKVLQQLHTKDVLALQDVIAALRSSSAFAQAAFDKEQSQVLRQEIDSLQQIADALSKRG